MAGIEQSLKAEADLGKVLIDLVVLAKGGISLGNLGEVFKLFNDLNAIGKDAALVLPELKDLDVQEGLQLLNGAYAVFKDISALLGS